MCPTILCPVVYFYLKTLAKLKINPDFIFQDDYLALVIENEYPKLIVDLGSGSQQIIVNKIVSDGKWYQAIIDRFVLLLGLLLNYYPWSFYSVFNYFF